MKKYYYEDGNSKNVYSMTFQVDDRHCDYEAFKKLATQYPYFHGFYEVMLIQCDGIHMYINDKAYILQKNDLIIFCPQDFHRYLLEDGQVYRRITCEFSGEYIEDFCTHNTDLLSCFINRPNDFCPIRRLDSMHAAKITDLMKTTQKSNGSSDYGEDLSAKCALIKILLEVNGLYDRMPNIELGEISAEYRRIKPIVDYINTHLNYDLTIKTLADQFYISKYHFCRIFKKTLGYTVNEYVTCRRILNAAALLRDGVGVTQTWEKVTPEDMSYFIKVFKKLMGVTPKQYAKQFQK